MKIAKWFSMIKLTLCVKQKSVDWTVFFFFLILLGQACLPLMWFNKFIVGEVIIIM